MKTLNRIVIIGGTVAVVAMAMAAVTFNEQHGTGFVGKGDVQVLYGWNDKQLQDNHGGVSFEARKTVTTERVWQCVRTTNQGDEVVSERNNSSTIQSRGVVDKIARDRKNKITGFFLDGYGEATITNAGDQGPSTGSCPGSASFVEGSVVEETFVSASNLFVSYGGERFQLAY
jgi:hypothetical protein